VTERDSVLSTLSGEELHGRRKILTDKKQITDNNVVDVVNKSLTVHRQNSTEIKYLYDCYRGIQDIRNKTKMVRPEINNKVAVNIPNEIVTFKTAYFMSGPLQYVSTGGDDKVSEQIRQLNEYMQAEDKDSKDKEICDWMHICGVAPRMVLPDSEAGEEEGSPVCIYTLNPQDAFVIYYSGIGQKPLAGVIIQRDESGQEEYCVYTKDMCYLIQNDQIKKRHPHIMGYVNIFEYLNNEARMGAFEIVLPLLNAINTLESNRVDSIEDFVNSFDVFQNCDIEDDKYKQLTSGGQVIRIKSTMPGLEAKVYRITSELSQMGVQTAIDDLTDRYITICGMPNRNGGSSTSDTGQGVIYRDGWAEADSRANDTEKMFNRAEREFLRLVLKILATTTDLNLKLSDIKIEHARNNLNNMQSRMQILCEGLNNEKIHPKIPWIVAGMPNSEEWYRISMQYYEEQQAELEKQLEREAPQENNSSENEEGDMVRENG